jgi:hypothetical protein
MEHVAGVDDFETGGRDLLGRRPTMAAGQGHAASGRAGGEEELAGIKSPAEAGLSNRDSKRDELTRRGRRI